MFGPIPVNRLGHDLGAGTTPIESAAERGFADSVSQERVLRVKRVRKTAWVPIGVAVCLAGIAGAAGQTFADFEVSSAPGLLRAGGLSVVSEAPIAAAGDATGFEADSVVTDDPGRWGGGAPEAIANFDYEGLPGRLSDPVLRPLWRAGLDLERRGRLLESARYYEAIIVAVPEESYTYWRAARNYWRIGENHPVDLKEQRGRYFDLAESWSGRGLEVDPDCGACMLWKFVSMGRQATTRGLLTAVGDVREMDQLLSRGIRLAPSHRDNEGNATMGNLYYASSVFYRVIPEWFWLKWVIGVRGDREKSLDYARRAVELAPLRIDYRVELGASLLCSGLKDRKTRQIAEGEQVLAAVRQLEDFLSTDALDKVHAELLMRSPGRACGYSRDGFIDVDGLGKQVRTRS